MSTPLTRSFVSVTYLLGARGAELAERLPKDVLRVEGGLVRGLSEPDRDARAHFLAASLREVTQELLGRGLARTSSAAERGR